MTNFLGFKQVSKRTYDALSDAEKKNYMWLVRDGEYDETGKLIEADVKKSAIYFGSRLYAEVNNDETESSKISNIITALGEMVDDNGNFVGFLPLEAHEILGDVEIESVSDALVALETAILKKVKELEDKIDSAKTELETAISDAKDEAINTAIEAAEASAQTLDEKIDNVKGDLETVISDAKAEAIESADKHAQTMVESAKTELEASILEVDAKAEEAKSAAADVQSNVDELALEVEKKANAEDVYTKSEIDSKIAGTFHFKGSKPSKEELPTDAQIGDVWQVGDKEYAWNGTEWIELGFNIDLSEYAKTSEVNEKISAQTEVISEAIEVIEGEIDAIGEEINNVKDDLNVVSADTAALKAIATISVEKYSEIPEDLQLGQIVYVINDETVEGTVYNSGAYIKTAGGVKKLESTQSGGETVEDRVESLENKMGDTPVKKGEESMTVTAAVNELLNDTTHIISGDDVEE